jgi:hypothetical protein
VPVVVCGLQFLCGLGEKEGAPVGIPAHDAALREDDCASCLRDSTWGVKEGIGWYVRVGQRTLLLPRGGQAGPAQVSTSHS